MVQALEMDGLMLIPATDWIWHQRIPSIRHDFILPMEQSRLQHAPRFLSLFGISSVGREQGKGVGNPRLHLMHCIHGRQFLRAGDHALGPCIALVLGGRAIDLGGPDGVENYHARLISSRSINSKFDIVSH
jgi:hypothetical protein